MGNTGSQYAEKQSNQHTIPSVSGESSIYVPSATNNIWTAIEIYKTSLFLYFKNYLFLSGGIRRDNG